jgi:8-oxo-dGTP pyrophosphatase MutT (NUDIX family)
MRTDKELEWNTIEEEYLIKRRWLTAKVEKVQLPDGRIYDEYYTLEYPDWINVIAITKDGKMILEKQWRHAQRVVSTEIPAGVIEKGEEPLAAAKRELQEETGFGGGTWSEFMVLSPNPGSMNNHSHTFLAEGVEKISDTHLDETEDIEVFFRSQEEVYEMLKNGEFCQALMAAPLWKYFATKKIVDQH